MDFDSRFVLLDGLVVFTRAEVGVSLVKRDRETPSLSPFVGTDEQKNTYGFLSLFCLGESSLYTLCAFESSRLCLFFLVAWLCGDRASDTGSATGVGRLFAFGTHLECSKSVILSRVNVSF